MDIIIIHILLLVAAVVIILLGVYINHLWRLTQKLEKEKAELEKEALTDHQTGLLNSRGGIKTFDVSMNATYARQRPRKKHRRVWAIMIDVDNFKQVNDSIGHQAGNEILAAVAKILNAHFRSTDICIRLSTAGDEFLVLMTNAEEKLVVNKTEEFRQGVEKDSRLRLRNDTQVTVSVGIAGTEPDDEFGNSVKLLEMIMERADAALYQAKHAGRNQAVLWGKEEN